MCVNVLGFILNKNLKSNDDCLKKFLKIKLGISLFYSVKRKLFQNTFDFEINKIHDDFQIV